MMAAGRVTIHMVASLDGVDLVALGYRVKEASSPGRATHLVAGGRDGRRGRAAAELVDTPFGTTNHSATDVGSHRSGRWRNDRSGGAAVAVREPRINSAHLVTAAQPDPTEDSCDRW